MGYLKIFSKRCERNDRELCCGDTAVGKNETKGYQRLASPVFVTKPGMSAQMETGKDNSTDYRIKVTVTEK